MSIKGLNKIEDLLSSNSYPGRGIIIGESADGKKAMMAYFIMGRSVNSRNRVFERFNGGLRTKAFDEKKLSDPNLIIYNPYLSYKRYDIITNGDQTNTIFDVISNDGGEFSFESALSTRKFEPDAPNFTPRISAIINYDNNNGFGYKLSVLKSSDGNPDSCDRFYYNYTPISGLGHFVHTYEHDGDPIPSFYGEPERIIMPNTAEELSDIIWNNLNVDNKVSLFVRAVPLNGDAPVEIITNKNK